MPERQERGQALQLARDGLAATSDDARRRGCHARARPRPVRLPAHLPGRHKANSTTMDSGLSSAYSSAYSSAQSSAYSSLSAYSSPEHPQELSQAEAKMRPETTASPRRAATT